jgi:hypothetical protein
MWNGIDDCTATSILVNRIGRFQLTGDYTVSYQTEDLLVLLVKLDILIDEEEWEFFVLEKGRITI